MDFRYSANQTVSGFISAFDKRIVAAYSSPVKYFIPFGRRIFATWPPERKLSTSFVTRGPIVVPDNSFGRRKVVITLSTEMERPVR